MYINPDHWYLFCKFELEDEQALVIDLVPPECLWWGLYATNRYMRTFEYANGAHNLVGIGNAVREPDGSVHIVVSERDTGAPNWIDTGGRRDGTLVVRWTITGLDPDVKPTVPVPTTRVVPVNELLGP